MSLYGALYSGVSGLSSESSAMGAIADNITNINTVGYKATDVNFSTLVTQQVSLTEYSPGGVESKPRAGIDVQGLLQATNSSTDMAISGQGFFVVNTTSDPAVDGGEFAYTRAGSFTTDQNGFLQNSSGFYLMGWPLTPTDNSAASVPSTQTINGTKYMAAYKNADGTFHYINQNIVSTTELQPLNLNDIGGTAQATSNVSVQGNLPSGDPIYNPEDPSNGGIHDTNVLVYDSLGDSENAQFQWTKVADNAWQLSATPPSGAAVVTLTNQSTAFGSLVYSSAGQLEFNSIPPDGSYFTLTSDVNGTPSTVQVQFYDSSKNQSNPTVDYQSSGNAILGVDVNGISTTTELAAQIAKTIQTAANTPYSNTPPTVNISSTLLGGMADGANRFVASSNTLQIIQEPGAAAVTVNCVADSATGLGDSIVESGTGVGSSSSNPGEFTIPSIYAGSTVAGSPASYTQINAVPATTFTINSAPTGNFEIGNAYIKWSDLEAGGSLANYYVNGVATAPSPAITLPNTGPGLTPSQLAQNLQAAISGLATQASNFSGLSATVNGSQVTLALAGSSAAVTPDSSGTQGEITWSDAADGTTFVELAPNSNTNASSAFTINNVPTSGFLTIGSVEIPWTQIAAGKVTSWTDSVTGNTTTLGTPVVLPHGTNGTDATALLATDTAKLADNAGVAIAGVAADTTAETGGLPSAAARLAGVTGTSFNSTVTIGSSTQAEVVIPDKGGTASDITWSNTSSGATAELLGPTGTYSSSGYAVTFNGNGTPASIIPNTMQLFWANGAENQDVTTGSATEEPQVSLNFGDLNQADGLTQLSGDFQVTPNQNGAKFGNFSGVSIGTNGIVTALFDNGVRAPVFQIPIATFANPDGLQSLTGNVWIDTTDSGSYNLRTPGEAGSGTVQESSLESSTADLGTEFTTMITVQRAYSAAAKIITTTDQMLSDLINIIPQ